MEQAAVTSIPESPPAVEEPFVTLRGATWADYQRLLELRGEKSYPRIAYLEGVLQLMSPSNRHEGVAAMIGCLFEAWCFESGVEVTPYGSWTLERKEKGRGVEADECYVLGEHDEPELPDLAIEVVRTSGGINKLAIYGKLGVREVWFWIKGAIEVYALRGEDYERVEKSELFPALDLALLLSFVDTTPMTRAVRAYREALAAAGR